MTEINVAFNWQREPAAEQLILGLLGQAIERNQFLARLEKELFKGCSTDLLAWVDHVACGLDHLEQVEKTGFQLMHTRDQYQIYRHLGAKLPDIVLKEDNSISAVALSVDSIADFLMVRGLSCPIEGSPYSGFRRCLISNENNCELWVVERRGVETIEPLYVTPEALSAYFEAKELWMSRPRGLKEEEEQLLESIRLANAIVELLGENGAACLVLECERAYWQTRNTAGQIQKNRQDRLGMGWANHDHHTFRSSRRHFTKLVKLFEILGFHCRERYYAGQEGGWGAQIMENPAAKLVLFLDVDLAPHEVEIDFAHEVLGEKEKLGTIGLWCALHGDSILHAGMHHLEAQFAFDEMRDDLKQHGIGMMEPFSNFPYLKQAFTHGEVWPVNEERLARCLGSGRITQEEANKFRHYGALGSHLENLQRKEGYKGFNQKNVSLIIHKTDPRLTK